MNFSQLITSLRNLDGSLKSHVSQSANIGLTLRNWLVEAYLIEFEQNGEDRADYGESLISDIAGKLAVKGLGARNLESCRLFYRAYPEIPQTVSTEPLKPLIISRLKIPQTTSGEYKAQRSSRPSCVPLSKAHVFPHESLQYCINGIRIHISKS